MTRKEHGQRSISLWPTEQWKKAAPEAVGMDSGDLSEVFGGWREQNIHSVVVVRKGHLVAEAYEGVIHPEKLQDMKSCTKVVTSSLVGMALQEKHLTSLDQSIAEFFPQIQSDERKSRIKLRHLLTMTSGLHWDNVNDQSSNEMMYSANWHEYVLDRPMAHEPGTKFVYSNGDAHLLSVILQKAIGENLLDYAMSRLFRPLGINKASWNQDPQGYTIGAWALALTAQDMAKLGFLFLKKGQWEGQALLPRSWMKDALTVRSKHLYADGSKGGYGFYWYLKQIPAENGKSYEVYYAAGSGGRRIYIVPALQMVVTLTANTEDPHVPDQVLKRVLRSVKTNGSLPIHEQATDRLQQAIQATRGDGLLI